MLIFYIDHSVCINTNGAIVFELKQDFETVLIFCFVFCSFNFKFYIDSLLQYSEKQRLFSFVNCILVVVPTNYTMLYLAIFLLCVQLAIGQICTFIPNDNLSSLNYLDTRSNRLKTTNDYSVFEVLGKHWSTDNEVWLEVKDAHIKVSVYGGTGIIQEEH